MAAAGIHAALTPIWKIKRNSEETYKNFGSHGAI